MCVDQVWTLAFAAGKINDTLIEDTILFSGHIHVDYAHN